MTIDYSKYKKSDVLNAFVCDVCVRNAKLLPKQPADSGSSSWLCACCGHMNIGSQMICIINDWLEIEPIGYVEE